MICAKPFPCTFQNKQLRPAVTRDFEIHGGMNVQSRLEKKQTLTLTWPYSHSFDIEHGDFDPHLMKIWTKRLMAMALQTNIHIGEKLNAEVINQKPLFTWSNISWNFGILGLCKWIMRTPALCRRQNRPPRMLGWRKGYLKTLEIAFNLNKKCKQQGREFRQN